MYINEKHLPYKMLYRSTSSQTYFDTFYKHMETNIIIFTSTYKRYSLQDIQSD